MGIGDGRGHNDKYSHYNRMAELLDKGRASDTTRGEIPLRRGKYGMDVEEYLEWKALEAAKCKVKVPE